MLMHVAQLPQREKERERESLMPDEIIHYTSARHVYENVWTACKTWLKPHNGYYKPRQADVTQNPDGAGAGGSRERTHTAR